MNDEIKIEKDMTPKLIGETYMKYPTEKSRQRYKYGLYECAYCGNHWEVMVHSINSESTKSCGCQKGCITHGLSSNKFYQTWYDMKYRCYNNMRQDYKDYGARGITVCEEWLNVSNFVAWCEMTHPNTEGVSLDRIDNDKGYSPENCTWSDKTTQNINQRIQKNNTSGYVGVSWDKSHNLWQVNIRVNKKLIKIGRYKDIENAKIARLKAELKYFGTELAPQRHLFEEYKIT